MLQRDTCRQRRRQCSGSRSTAFGGVRRQGSRTFACALRSRHRGVDNNVSQEVQSAMEHSTLEKATSFTHVFWDPDPQAVGE